MTGRRGAVLVLVVAALATAVYGAAATLGVSSARIDTFEAGVAASTSTSSTSTSSSSTSSSTTSSSTTTTTAPPAPDETYFVATQGNGDNNFLVSYTTSWSFIRSTKLGLTGTDGRIPRGVASDATFAYVLDSADYLFRYTLVGGSAQKSRTLDDLGTPVGLALDGDELWVAEATSGSVTTLRLYSLSAAFNGTSTALDPIRSIAVNNFGGTVGLAVDATNLYLLGGTTVGRVARSSASSGSATPSVTLRTAAGTNLAGTRGATISGTLFFALTSSGNNNGVAHEFQLSALYSGSSPLNATASHTLSSISGSPQGL